ncbi:MAG: asparaginase [Gemmatimonadota bacterium]|nr:asparaginase [Gemmatimonadota bacterium]
MSRATQPVARVAVPGTVAILFTGGTISMKYDAAAGGAVPALSADEILEAARGIRDIAPLAPEQWGRYPGPHMTVEKQWALRGRIAELLADPAITGVVVTHGTDSLEETAYLVARSVASEKPVVFTGAMRSASDLGWDGPANLVDAVTIAAAPAARGSGVTVTFNGRIFAALDEAKTHTHLLDAFESPGLGPLGVVDEGQVLFRRAVLSAALPLMPPVPATPVDLITAYAGADARLLDASRETGARGVVLAAMGRGNVPPEMVPGIERAIAAGLPVVITSRAQRGRVGMTYGYPGGGRRLAEMGCWFAGPRRPTQARVDLMLALGAGVALGEVFER